MSRKPFVQLTGEDGNVFNLIGICSRAMQQRVFQAGSYEEALGILGEYVEIR